MGGALKADTPIQGEAASLAHYQLLRPVTDALGPGLTRGRGDLLLLDTLSLVVVEVGVDRHQSGHPDLGGEA